MAIATLEQIIEIYPHPNADTLEIAKVKEYKTIVKKGMYKKYDSVIFIHPDTCLPEVDWATSFLKYSKNRVKAMRIRGEYSDGIIINSNILSSYKEFTTNYYGKEYGEILGIKKYIKKEPNDLQAKGDLPFGIFKTDEERWENYDKKIPFGEKVDITLKIDGSSASFYCKKINGNWIKGITSRNLDLKLDAKNIFTKINEKYEILDKLDLFCRDMGVSCAIRGEIYGGKIQASKINPHANLPLDIAFFNVLNLDTLKYEYFGELNYKKICAKFGLPSIPLLEEDVILTQELINKYANNLILPEIERFKISTFEGVVVKHQKGSFKVINKNYDEKN